MVKIKSLLANNYNCIFEHKSEMASWNPSLIFSYKYSY
jgi:hypothetical protein